MRLGLHVGYWGLGVSGEEQLQLAKEADRLGYDSEASFSRAFKRVIGHAPSLAKALAE